MTNSPPDATVSLVTDCTGRSPEGMAGTASRAVGGRPAEAPEMTPREEGEEGEREREGGKRGKGGGGGKKRGEERKQTCALPI